MSRKHEEVMREFIELYKGKKCLWKIKSKEYSNKTLKEEAYGTLIRKLKELNEDAKKDDVIKKINSLRSCFRKEFKKVMDSKKSGAGTKEIYKPSLWYFELLLFLKDQEIPREGVGFDTPNFMDEITRNKSDSDVGDGDAEGEESEIQERNEVLENMPRTPQSTISTLSLSNSSRSSATKKRRSKNTQRNDNNAAESLMTLVNEKLSSCRREDEFDIIGKNVAEKLRNLPPQMKLFAEKIINDCLFEAQLGNLNRYAVPEPPRSVQPHCPQSFEYLRGPLNTNMHLQGQRSNQDPSQVQQFAAYDYESPAISPNTQNSKMETNSVRSYYSTIQESLDNV